MDSYVEKILEHVRTRDKEEPEFCQAVTEVLDSIRPALQRYDKYERSSILERLVEPDRMIVFKIPWIDDQAVHRVNRGYRVQFNNSIGPYKGGLRFHPTVNLSIIMFLAFEQTFKNALTTLPMGGAKGGSDFDPKGKSDNEVMRFCQSMMIELHKYIGSNTDVPAGDIGVGAREIGFLFGQYKRLSNEFVGVLTGKGINWGGSHIRPEATGYGCVYFADEMLKTRNETLEGKTCLVSGSGNVAQYAVEKLTAKGAKVVSMSDSNGTVYDPAGIDAEKLAWVMELKNTHRGRIREYAEKFSGVEYRENARPWDIPCDCAFPCATQNEIDETNAKTLLKQGCMLVSEGANMPTNPNGVDLFLEEKILYGPGKAANAGGVAVSGLEMGQNAQMLHWTREQVDAKLTEIMQSIHTSCRETAEEYGDPGNYVKGANIAGFIKVADSMLDQGNT